MLVHKLADEKARDETDLEALDKFLLSDLAPAESMRPSEPLRRSAKVGRNDPCPCGSGKKFKKCCGKAA